MDAKTTELSVSDEKAAFRLFYEPVILEHTLIQVPQTTRTSPAGSRMVEPHPFMPHEELFRYFVYKLAQMCDSSRGGSTVTAVAVLKGPEGPEYVFASNDRDGEELLDTKRHIGDILRFVGTSIEKPEANKSKAPAKPLKKMVLWNILWFNRQRVRVYVNCAAKHLEQCIQHCALSHSSDQSKP